MPTLLAVNSLDDIPEEYRETPVGKLLEYHNLGCPWKKYEDARMLIGMCMDQRKSLNIPKNFAFIIRDGGARMTGKEFAMSFAIGFGGVRHIAIIGHSQCGMVNIDMKKDKFINGMIEAVGWTKDEAEEQFVTGAAACGIDDAASFTMGQVRMLRERYHGILIAGLFFKVEDSRLYLIRE